MGLCGYVDESLMNDDLQQIDIGTQVFAGVGCKRLGSVSFIGPTQFAEGEWIGVTLDVPSGKNDGSVNGVRYFQCEPFYGLFSRRNNLRIPTPDELAQFHAVKQTNTSGLDMDSCAMFNSVASTAST
ncbi:unnamed protein product, partial [Protopolystoma xenopodis]